MIERSTGGAPRGRARRFRQWLPPRLQRRRGATGDTPAAASAFPTCAARDTRDPPAPGSPAAGCTAGVGRCPAQLAAPPGTRAPVAAAESEPRGPRDREPAARCGRPRVVKVEPLPRVHPQAPQPQGVVFDERLSTRGRRRSPGSAARQGAAQEQTGRAAPDDGDGDMHPSTSIGSRTMQAPVHQSRVKGPSPLSRPCSGAT